MDVYAINFVGFNGHDSPRHTLTADFVVQPFALEEGARLGVGQAVDAALGMQDHRAGHHRARKTTAAHFVDARHRHETVAVETVLDVPASGDLHHHRPPLR